MSFTLKERGLRAVFALCQELNRGSQKECSEKKYGAGQQRTTPENVEGQPLFQISTLHYKNCLGALVCARTHTHRSVTTTYSLHSTYSPILTSWNSQILTPLLHTQSLTTLEWLL